MASTLKVVKTAKTNAQSIVYELLASNPDDDYTSAEIAEETGLSHQHVNRILKDLIASSRPITVSHYTNDNGREVNIYSFCKTTDVHRNVHRKNSDPSLNLPPQDIDAWLLNQIALHPTITMSQLAQQSHLSLKTIQRHIASMPHIHHTGPTKRGRWTITTPQ